MKAEQTWMAYTLRLIIAIIIVLSTYDCNITLKWLRWSRGSVLAFGNQVRGVQTDGRSSRIFQGEKIKNSQHAFLQRGSKAVGPMS
jgi:hypothetical protein